jgi:hypothetical protein
VTRPVRTSWGTTDRYSTCPDCDGSGEAECSWCKAIPAYDIGAGERVCHGCLREFVADCYADDATRAMLAALDAGATDGETESRALRAEEEN